MISTSLKKRNFPCTNRNSISFFWWRPVIKWVFQIVILSLIFHRDYCVILTKRIPDQAGCRTGEKVGMNFFFIFLYVYSFICSKNFEFINFLYFQNFQEIYLKTPILLEKVSKLRTKIVLLPINFSNKFIGKIVLLLISYWHSIEIVALFINCLMSHSLFWFYRESHCSNPSS